MDVSHPINTLIPSLDGPVLEVLAGTTRPLSGREIARLLPRRATHVGVQKVLDRLAHGGLVLQEERGTAVLNTLNRDHVLAPAVLAAARAFRIFTEGLSTLARSLEPRPERAVLFGSAARKEADADSDIDLLVVWSSDADEAAMFDAEDQLRVYVERSTGNHCQIVSYREEAYERLASTSPDFWENIQLDAFDLLGA